MIIGSAQGFFVRVWRRVWRLIFYATAL